MEKKSKKNISRTGSGVQENSRAISVASKGREASVKNKGGDLKPSNSSGLDYLQLRQHLEASLENKDLDYK